MMHKVQIYKLGTLRVQDKKRHLTLTSDAFFRKPYGHSFQRVNRVRSLVLP